mmetsp:Transcript_14428/g.20230  ORF Transcript_14428/g.20230 Transcript_14428/m.20230 type:complete len:219 (+) Transcript_14428:17-673(+)|eukprot:jgi/Bigna1/87668/estExt_fgenesh1_pg.C_220221
MAALRRALASLRKLPGNRKFAAKSFTPSLRIPSFCNAFSSFSAVEDPDKKEIVGPPPPENIWFVEEDVKDNVVPEEQKDAINRLLSVKNASLPEQLKQDVAKAIAKWRKHEADVGSPAASIAAMSERIKYLHRHMRANHKDKHSMYGINALINKRRYMLKYLAKKDFKAFKGLVNEYEISTLELMTDQQASHRGWTERNARRRAKRGKRRFPPYHQVE